MPEYEKIKKETVSCGAAFSSAFKNLFQIKISSAKHLTQAASNFTSKNFASFISSDYTRKTRSEIAIMKTLVKINDDEVGWSYTDGQNMFRLYFDHIPEILKKRVLRYGFNQKTHDKLEN